MNSILVAFDGTPVAGGAGIRTPVIQRGEQVFAKDRAPFDPVELDRLAKTGHVTRLREPLAVEEGDGLVLYRHRDFVLPGVEYEDDTVTWRDDDGVQLAYLSVASARHWLATSAHVAYLLARATFRRGALDDARRFARRGLMLSPGLASSNTAAHLYGVLLAIDERRGGDALISHEIVAMLDEVRTKMAVERAAGMLRSLRRVPDAADIRTLDRAVHIGDDESPRRRAA